MSSSMGSRGKMDLSKVRTRYEPPTLDEAIFAAKGLTRNTDAQVQLASQLAGRSEAEVRAAVLQARQRPAQRTTARVAGALQPVLVERRAATYRSSRS